MKSQKSYYTGHHWVMSKYRKRQGIDIYASSQHNIYRLFRGCTKYKCDPWTAYYFLGGWWCQIRSWYPVIDAGSMLGQRRRRCSNIDQTYPAFPNMIIFLNERLQQIFNGFQWYFTKPTYSIWMIRKCSCYMYLVNVTTSMMWDHLTYALVYVRSLSLPGLLGRSEITQPTCNRSTWLIWYH